MKDFKLIIIIVFGLLLCSECVKEEYVIATSDDVLMGAYFEQESEQFSSFLDMLVKSEFLSFLNAYGAYTCFAPTNEAIDAYLVSKGKNSLDDFDPDELKDLVRYHIIADTLNSTRFTDGKLPTPNMYGQYLTAVTHFLDGKATVKINKYAESEVIDIRVANGIIHSMKSVLEPVETPIAGLIEADPKLSIFSEALKETGYHDTLMMISDRELEAAEKRWFTVLVHKDSVYNAEGIYSYDDLKAKYSDTGNPKNPKDSLNLHIAYHILDNSLKYVADLIQSNAHLTMAPLEVITLKQNQDSVLINEDEYRGIIEKGALLNRPESDNIAANGVYHVVDESFFIKVRLPYPIYWEPTDQPEIRKLPGVFRVPGQTADLELGQLENITWDKDQSIKYIVHADATQGKYLVNSDQFQIPLRQKGINWIEFTTPLIVKGKYKLWICTRNVDDPGRRPVFLVSFNGTTLPNIVSTEATMPRGLTDEELLVQGYKRYNYEPTDSTYLTDAGGRFASSLAGTIDVPTTGNHTIKFTAINDGDKGLWFDMIHIIPIESNQIWPRVAHDGSLADKPDWYPLPVDDN